MLTIMPLRTLFAARVTGLDLGQELDEATFGRVRDAFERYSVLVFPGQKITDRHRSASASGLDRWRPPVPGRTAPAAS